MRNDCWPAHWGIRRDDLAQKGRKAQLKYTRGWGDNETQVRHIKVIAMAGNLTGRGG